ncbi:MAG: alpha/beta hydrolase [Proteobacteria bacterium]|nr:alpha/beta hydrolase [Pseudomonadota bacterium]
MTSFTSWQIDAVSRRAKLAEMLGSNREDAIEPLQCAELFNAGIKDSRLVVLENAGHVPTITQPAEVAEAIEEL